MLGYTIRRFFAAIPILWAVATLVFVIFRLVPGDPAQLIAGPHATEQSIQAIRQDLGLDQPVFVQYVDYLAGLLQGDFGRSVQFDSGVAAVILSRIPLTATLALGGMGLALLVGITAGVLSSVRAGTWLDNLVLWLAVSAGGLPNFFLGLVLAWLFAVQLQLVPVAGGSGFSALILPMVTLAAYPTAIIARLVRSSMLEVLNMPFLTAARAKGMSELRILVRHALRNAVIPTVTMVALLLGYFLGGSIIVETVFGQPGLGLLMTGAIDRRDYAMVQAISLFYGMVFILLNLVVDLAYAVLDPRTRRAG